MRVRNVRQREVNSTERLPLERVEEEQEGRETTPFTEKHIIENLSVEPYQADKAMCFYSMLNQGNKRGK